MDYIWTNHARKRLTDRKIPEKYIEQTLRSPDRTVEKSSGSVEILKRIEERTAAVLVKHTQKGEKLIISVWIDPPFPGTKDYKKKIRYHQMQKASTWKKIWLTILDQLGL